MKLTFTETCLLNYRNRSRSVLKQFKIQLKRTTLNIRKSAKNAKQLVLKAGANLKQRPSKSLVKASTPPLGESEKEKEKENGSDNEYVNEDKNKEAVSVDKQTYVGAPNVEDVAAYCQESGYTIDPAAFVRWNEERGWMNGKKYIAVDWRKTVRKWFCKENGLSYLEIETLTNVCSDVLGKVKAVQHG